MKKQLLHTPDGVRDIYNGECKQKLVLQEKLGEVMTSFGYDRIETPTFEFLRVLGDEADGVSDRDLYKFFDKEGNTLVLRPDFTPSIARCAAKYYTEAQSPVKLCYMGNTFMNSSSYQGRLKETTQCGAELIGDSTLEGDAEILAMVVEALKASGLVEFQISVGHAALFAELTKEAGFSDYQKEDLAELLNNKNFFGVEELLDCISISEQLTELFGLLQKFDVSTEDLKAAIMESKDYPTIHKALSELLELTEMLQVYGISKYISLELGIVPTHPYYTGIIFKGYTFGTGEAIVKGGRYDKLISRFGKDTPAIGFAIVVDQLLNALHRQKIMIPTTNQTELVLFTKEMREQAITYAIHQRSQKTPVKLLMVSEDQLDAWVDDGTYCSVIRLK